MPFPLPNSEPIKIQKKIILEDTILKYIPNTEPKIKKNITKSVLPKPIPKCEPTKAI